MTWVEVTSHEKYQSCSRSATLNSVYSLQLHTNHYPHKWVCCSQQRDTKAADRFCFAKTQGHSATFNLTHVLITPKQTIVTSIASRQNYQKSFAYRVINACHGEGGQFLLKLFLENTKMCRHLSFKFFELGIYSTYGSFREWKDGSRKFPYVYKNTPGNRGTQR